MIDILSVIPHRDPFLFVDEIVSISETEILAKKIFSFEKNQFYRGHYPENPITPGVILCESVFQTAAVLLSQKQIDSKHIPTDNSKKLVPVLSKIENARFKSIVRPGEELLISVTLLEQIGKFSILSGVIKKHDNTIVLRINFTLGYVEE